MKKIPALRSGLASSAPSAFTLLELLVSMGVTALLTVLLLTITDSVLSNYRLLRAGAGTEREAAAAIDRMVTDLEAMSVPVNGDAGALRQSTESVSGRVFPWLVMLSATRDVDSPGHEGATRAVSFRVAYQDPVTATGTSARFGLYRSVLTAAETFNDVMDKDHLQTAFTKVRSPTGNRLELLCDHVADFQIRFHNPTTGAWTTVSTPGGFVRIAREGAFVGTGNAPGTKVPGGFDAIEVTLSVLSKEGSQMVQSGALTLEAAAERHARKFTRRTSVLGHSPVR